MFFFPKSCCYVFLQTTMTCAGTGEDLHSSLCSGVPALTAGTVGKSGGSMSKSPAGSCGIRDEHKLSSFKVSPLRNRKFKGLMWLYFLVLVSGGTPESRPSQQPKPLETPSPAVAGALSRRGGLSRRRRPFLVRRRSNPLSPRRDAGRGRGTAAAQRPRGEARRRRGLTERSSGSVKSGGPGGAFRRFATEPEPLQRRSFVMNGPPILLGGYLSINDENSWLSSSEGGALSCGMGDGQEQEERLKEVFESFDASGCGSLTPEELADLCRSLQLEDATPALLHAVLQDQDRPTARVDFQQFKNALIQVLYAAFPGAQEEQEAPPPTASPEIQPKFVKGSKRYGRRSTPEFLEPASGIPDVPDTNSTERGLEDNDDSAVPRKRERWNSQESSSEEFEAEGQMHLWNPDGPSTPRGSVAPLSVRLEAELRHACEELGVAWDGRAARSELLVLCERLGLELGADALLDPDEQTDVQEFVSRLVTRQQPPTPSASTPYRQLKRHHSSSGGRRILAFCSGTATPLFSWLDDGAGHAAVESVLEAWMDEGVENGVEILQVLDLELDGKLNLADLTAALESELLGAKSEVLQAALASFRAEIRHLLENVEQEIREKEKIRSDLEKAEKQRTQLASEVDERHAAIERLNSLNLRKLEQEHQERLGSVRSELRKEVEQIQQHAALQREEVEAELAKIKEEESLLRDHLSISLKENRRLETELLDGAEKLEEARSQILKLQRSLENLSKDKFGELEPGSADLLLQEERLQQLRRGYEAQCRELQDRIDELQSELQDVHALSKGHAHPHKALSEELESQSPGMESDPGIGSEEVQPFSMSLEAEMMLERLKEQHLLQVEELHHQLEVKVNEFNRRLEEQQEVHEEQEASLSLRYQQELRALREEMLSVQNQHVEPKPAAGGEEEQLRQQLLEALRVSADLEEQLKILEVQRTEEKLQLLSEMEELKEQHAEEISKLKEEQEELQEARAELQEEMDELERRLSAGWEKEKGALEETHENLLRVRLEEVKVKFEEEKGELVRREQEEKEGSLREAWDRERAQLEEHHEEVLRRRILELQEQSEQKERRLREAWEEEKLQLEEDYEGMIQERLSQETEKLEEEKERMEKEVAEEKERMEKEVAEEKERMEKEVAEEKERMEKEVAEEKERMEKEVAEEKERHGGAAQGGGEGAEHQTRRGAERAERRAAEAAGRRGSGEIRSWPSGSRKPGPPEEDQRSEGRRPEPGGAAANAGAAEEGEVCGPESRRELQETEPTAGGRERPSDGEERPERR
ncbi:Ninein [Oryzias melastigma]|uniref:Ninein n=1 Tax=Oryzias melastigma TaxID=30732 RepID=A0A834CC08_ORYME|nr:Ninein [Oryzias melastigma]